MAARARAGKVHPEDIEGSTFSISNLGMYDVENFVAIINPPEAAILAVGSAKPAPVVVDGEMKAGMRMRATISADHRVTDGAEAAQFMKPWRITSKNRWFYWFKYLCGFFALSLAGRKIHIRH